MNNIPPSALITLGPASDRQSGYRQVIDGITYETNGISWDDITEQDVPLVHTADTPPDPATLGAGDSAVLTGTFAADVTSVLLTVDYVKGVKSWTGTVISANDPVDADGLPDGVTWVKV